MLRCLWQTWLISSYAACKTQFVLYEFHFHFISISKESSFSSSGTSQFNFCVVCRPLVVNIMKPRKVLQLSHGCCCSGWRTHAACQVIILKANKDTCAKAIAKQFLWLLLAAYPSPLSLLHYPLFFTILSSLFVVMLIVWQILWVELPALWLELGRLWLKFCHLPFTLLLRCVLTFDIDLTPLTSTELRPAPAPTSTPTPASTSPLTVIPTLATDRLWIVLHFSRHALEFHLDLWHVVCGHRSPSPAAVRLLP